MISSILNSKQIYAAACVLGSFVATVPLARATPLVTPPGGAQANIGGCVVANATGIFFFDAPCSSPNVYTPGGPDTGSYAGLTGGTIQNLTGTPVVGNLPAPIVKFATFNTSAGVVSFDLTNIDPGRGTAAGCTSNAVGSTCTLPGSPVTLTQVAPDSVAISLGLNGVAYLGSSATGSSPTGALFTSQNLIPGTITGIVAQLVSPQGFKSSYSATFNSVSQAVTGCPLNTLQALTGNWTFSIDGSALPGTMLGSGGNFVATVGTDRSGALTGILVITQSASIGGGIVRQETDAGKFQVNSDCSGGTLTFNVSSRPAQFDFFFINANQIALIGSNNGSVLTGQATRTAPSSGCPAAPLTALSGTWVFSSEGFSASGQLTQGAAGRFVADNGLLTVTQTSSNSGSVTRQETDAGRYQLNSDCTGGTLTFNVSSRPVQFDFYFVSPNEITLVDTNNGDIITGDARRFGM